MHRILKNTLSISNLYVCDFCYKYSLLLFTEVIVNLASLLPKDNYQIEKESNRSK